MCLCGQFTCFLLVDAKLNLPISGLRMENFFTRRDGSDEAKLFGSRQKMVKTMAQLSLQLVVKPSGLGNPKTAQKFQFI